MKWNYSVKKFLTALCLVVPLCLLQGCTAEENFEKSWYDFGQDFVNIETALMQGTQVYREKIQMVFDQYKAVINYEFPSGAILYNGPMGTTAEPKVYWSRANEPYVGLVIDIYLNLLGYIGERYRDEFIPRNVFIVDTLAQKRGGSLVLANSALPNKLLLSGAGPEIGNLLKTNEKIKSKHKIGAQETFRGVFLSGVMLKLYAENKVSLCKQACELVPTDISGLKYSNRGEYGSVGSAYLFTSDYEKFLYKDQENYATEWLKLGEEQFKATYLKSSFDKKGLVAQKLALILEFYKSELGIDLRALGSKQSLLLEE